MTSKIEWTDETWNPLRGCSRVSDGCRNCYAEREAVRKKNGSYKGLVVSSPKGPRWTGKIQLVPTKLEEPLRWGTSRKVFVNSMSDLFHPDVPYEFIAAVFGVMAATPRHIYQLLTKREGVARAFFDWLEQKAEQARGSVFPNDSIDWCRQHVLRAAALRQGVMHRTFTQAEFGSWPLANLCLGVSVEDQKTADARIPEILRCPAAVHICSYEPALAGVNFRPWLRCAGPVPTPESNAAFDSDMYECGRCGHLIGNHAGPRAECLECVGLGWLIVGGESGPRARPFDLDWARSAVEQCKDAGVPCFVKQLGADPRMDTEYGAGEPWVCAHRKGADPDEWPQDLNVREFPEVA